MARNTATNQRITATLPIGLVSGMPWSLFVVAKAANTTGEGYALQLSEGAAVDRNRTLGFRGDTVGDPAQLRLGGNPGGTTRLANSAGSFSANVYSALGATITSTTSYAVFLNGTATTGASLAYDAVSLANVTIGAYFSSSAYSSPLNQDVAEAAGWKGLALTDREQAAMAVGYSPKRIRPAGLSFYVPMFREVRDMNKILASLTDTGTTQASRHPRRIGFMW
jgi:hypothetical protein